MYYAYVNLCYCPENCSWVFKNNIMVSQVTTFSVYMEDIRGLLYLMILLLFNAVDIGGNMLWECTRDSPHTLLKSSASSSYYPFINIEM